MVTTNRITPCVFALLAACLVLSPGISAAAHPVSITSSYAYVTREQLTVNVEVFVEDLYLFHDLKPDDRDFLAPADIDKGIAAHKQFLSKRMVIRDVGGQPLAGRIVEVDSSKVPAEGVPLAELMAHQVVFQFDYELPVEPEFLTFSQHFTDDQILVPSEMRLIVKQEGAGTLLTATLKPDQPQTFRFSWTNPPLAPDASREQWESWIEKQKEETLGISSYSSVYSFLYIEDREVRLEILVPLLSLEDDILLARDDDDFLDLAEQEAARQQIEAYFVTGNTVEVDGVVVTPTVERCDFYGLDFKDFAMRSKPKPVSLANARVGLILAYKSDSTPSSVKLTWDRFNNYVWAIDMIVYAFEETSKVTLSALGKNNVFHWSGSASPRSIPELRPVKVDIPPRRQWSVPVASLTGILALPFMLLVVRRQRASLVRSLSAVAIWLGIIAAVWPLTRWEIDDPLAPPPRVTAKQADEIFATLHRNTYQAFALREESDIYDGLSSSVDGDLLSELYLQVRRSLEMQEQGGAVANVRQVTILDGKKRETSSRADLGDLGFHYHCSWTVEGTVEHWGHVHSRTNRYEAVFAVRPNESAWKFTDVELLSEQRVASETNVRGL